VLHGIAEADALNVTFVEYLATLHELERKQAFSPESPSSSKECLSGLGVFGAAKVVLSEPLHSGFPGRGGVDEGCKPWPDTGF
jgi:hypothetical protein